MKGEIKISVPEASVSLTVARLCVAMHQPVSNEQRLLEYMMTRAYRIGELYYYEVARSSIKSILKVTKLTERQRELCIEKLKKTGVIVGRYTEKGKKRIRRFEFSPFICGMIRLNLFVK